MTAVITRGPRFGPYPASSIPTQRTVRSPPLVAAPGLTATYIYSEGEAAEY